VPLNESKMMMMLVQLRPAAAANSTTPPLDVSQLKRYFSVYFQSIGENFISWYSA
jgi:hypothetical protein